MSCIFFEEVSGVRCTDPCMPSSNYCPFHHAMRHVDVSFDIDEDEDEDDDSGFTITVSPEIIMMLVLMWIVYHYTH